MSAPFLHVTPIAPRRHGNGLAMRTAMFSQALASLGETQILVVDDEAPDGVEGLVLRHLGTAGRHDTPLRLIFSMTDPVARATALRALGRPFASRRLSAPVIAEFARIAGERRWRGIVVSRAHLLPLIEALDDAPSCPVIVDLDDDDGALMRQQAQIARTEGNERRALWLEAEADAGDALIARNAGAVRLFTTASDEASGSLSRRLPLGNVATVVNGVEFPRSGRDPAARPTGLLFVGNLGYAPNVDGLTWFMREVWPRIAAAEPASHVVAAGSSAEPALDTLFTVPGARLVRDPADLGPLYMEAAAAIVPLRMGSGSRIKILEAGAYNVPVVSTQAGAAGLALDPERDVFLSDADPEAFAEACIRCLRDRAEAARRAASLRAFVGQRHDRRHIVADIAALLAPLTG